MIQKPTRIQKREGLLPALASSKRFQPHVKNDTRIGGELASSQLRASNRKREIASTAAPLYSERINS
jgi:hypothetical protein